MAATLTPAILPEKSGAGGHRIPELDGVRGLAIALVLFYHYAVFGVPGNQLLYYLSLPPHIMWSGVDLFFVLSGFLIGGILLDHRDSQSYYQTFYARRIHRIFPLYYGMIALFFAGLWMFPYSTLFAGTMPLWTYPLFAQNLTGDFTRSAPWIGVTWSLAVEEQFYLLFPFIVRSLSRKALLVLVGFCVLAVPLLRTLLVINGWRFEQIYPLLPCRADALALGVIAAIIMRTEAAKAWISEHRKILFLCLLALIASLPSMLKWTTYWYVGTVGYSILALMYFLLIMLVLIAPTKLMTKTFSAGWLRRLGVISYCAYLIHEPVRRSLFLLVERGKHPVITDLKTLMVTVAALFLTLGIAQVSWLVLEKPLIRRAHLRHQYIS